MNEQAKLVHHNNLLAHVNSQITGFASLCVHIPRLFVENGLRGPSRPNEEMGLIAALTPLGFNRMHSTLFPLLSTIMTILDWIDWS